MKIIITIFLFFSFQIFAQKNVILNEKFETYKYLDTINIYSKIYPTKLIEGSGTIKSKNKKIIGSIGFETEITKNLNGKLIRIYDSQSHFYKKQRKIPAKTINYETTIYFDKNEKPDLAKVIQETLIDEKIIESKTKFYDISTINFKNPNLGFHETRIRRLLFEIEN